MRLDKERGINGTRSFCSMMKNLILATAILFLISGFFPAGASGADLTLLAGAGLRQPVSELVSAFEKETGINVGVEYDGSGKLLVRYKASGVGDVYLPGSHVYVEKLAGMGKSGQSFPVVKHIPVIAVNPAKADEVNSLEDLTKAGIRVGLGDAKAMALGRTADEILKKSGLAAAVEKNVVVRAATVKQLTLYVLKNDVDAGIIARADVYQNRDKLKMIEIDPSLYTMDTVTAAVINTSEHPEEALKLAEYLSSPKAVEVFGRYGFLPIK